MDFYLNEKRDINQIPQNIPPQIEQKPIPQPIIPNPGYQLGYGQPVIMQPNGNVIIVNHSIPTIITSSPASRSKYPVSMTCLFCQLPITTIVEQTWNCGACCLCYLTGFCLFACIQVCSGKEIGCYDSIHRCPNCGSTLGTYSAI